MPICASAYAKDGGSSARFNGGGNLRRSLCVGDTLDPVRQFICRRSACLPRGHLCEYPRAVWGDKDAFARLLDMMYRHVLECTGDT